MPAPEHRPLHPRLRLRLRGLIVAAGLGAAGAAIESRLLIGAAMAVAAAGIVLGLLERRRADRAPDA